MTTPPLKDRAPRWLKSAADSTTRAYALGTSLVRPTPDLLVVGTKRGGTTSLFNYLVQHPGVLGLFPQVRGKKGTEFFFPEQHHDRAHGAAWYRSHFHTESYRRVLGRKLGYRPISFEASPYYIWDPRIPERVHAVAPQVKAILLVRDPVQRAWSHYQERVQNKVEPLSFEEALEAESGRLAGEPEKMAADPTYYSPAYDWYSYRSRGDYLPQIQRWHEFFPSGQLLILRSEDLYRDTQRTMDRICDFAGIPSHAMPTTKAYNATWRTRDSVPAESAEELQDYFEKRNVSLEEYLGFATNWW